jgi:hypothetical protein
MMSAVTPDEEARIRAWEELHRGEQVGDIAELRIALRLLDKARAATREAVAAERARCAQVAHDCAPVASAEYIRQRVLEG